MTRWWAGRPGAAEGPAGDGERERVRRCLRGDEAAWAEMYRLHAPGVARFLVRLNGGDDGLDDQVQEVFVTVLSSLSRYRGEARLSTWILGVAANVAAHHRRGEARRRGRFVLAADPDGGRTAEDVQDGAEARAELAVVTKALEDLPVDSRATWILAEVEGLETREVAAAQGIPEGTVRSRLFHVRRRLLEALLEAGFARTEAAGGGAGDGTVLRLVRSGADR